MKGTLTTNNEKMLMNLLITHGATISPRKMINRHLSGQFLYNASNCYQVDLVLFSFHCCSLLATCTAVCFKRCRFAKFIN